MENLTYDQTIELEENIKIKKQAESIYKNFLSNIKLLPSTLQKDGSFMYWHDQHNQIYISIYEGHFVWKCRFLHETYDVNITPSGIFAAIKAKNRGVNHLESSVSK